MHPSHYKWVLANLYPTSMNNAELVGLLYCSKVSSFQEPLYYGHLGDLVKCDHVTSADIIKVHYQDLLWCHYGRDFIPLVVLSKHYLQCVVYSFTSFLCRSYKFQYLLIDFV